jgi:D-alanine-D-alanine ligase-like ATP-grasp enzyme
MEPNSPTPPACAYCGDSPANHTVLFIDSTISVLTKVARTPRQKPPSILFRLEKSEIINGIIHLLFLLLRAIRVITFSEDIEKASSTRTKSIWNEAKRRGIPMQEILVFGMHRDQMRAWLPTKKGGTKYRWQYFDSIPTPPWNSQYGLAWVDDKQSLKKVFTEQDLPVAKGKSVFTARSAQTLQNELGVSVIAKPREGSRGRHTTVGISDPVELARAVKRAQQLCAFVLVEEYIEGRVYRATCVGSKVIGVMELVRPLIIADGVKTVNELREFHNEHGKAFPQLTDVEDSVHFRMAIEHQGYTLESIPVVGTPVLLAELEERTNGGYFVDCTDEIPAETIRVIERAAAVCGIDVVGFDIISKDLANVEERFVFIEANSLPYIEIHDIPYAGPVRNVSKAVFDLWL